MNCPHCQSPNTVRNGTSKGRQRWHCKDCGKTSLEPSANPTGRPRVGDKPMTPAERIKATRMRRRQQGDGKT